jgi:hypothetical protein
MVDSFSPSWSTEVAMDLDEIREAYEALMAAKHPSETFQRLDELKLAAGAAMDAQATEMMLDPFGKWSWTSLGALIGITRQAAHKRWCRKVDAAMSTRYREAREEAASNLR